MISRSLVAGPGSWAVFALLALGGCQSPEPLALDDPEEVEELHRSLGLYASSIDDLLRETRQGANVSGFSLGMLSYGILTTVSASDPHLHAYFCTDGQGLDTYLKTRFQDHPQRELAALDQLRAENNSPLRSSARFTLEALTHVPRAEDPPDIQQRSREELARALSQTEESLTAAADTPLRD